MMAELRAIPGTPNEIIARWLTAALRDAGVLRTGRVTGHTWESIGEDRGFSGALARLSLAYADAAASEPVPTSLIAKFPMAERNVESTYRTTQQHDDAAFRRHFERCAREVRFYQEIAPHGVTAVPRMYFGAADAEAGRIILLLEDVRAAHGGDVLAGCPPDAALLVLRAMAPLHARWWGNNSDAIPWLPSWSGDHAARQVRYRGQIALFLERFGSRLSPSIRDLVVRLGTHYGAILDALATSPSTVIHADLHLDNVLFNPPGTEPPAIILDWQSVSRGPAAADVALFLFGSLNPTECRAHEDALLRDYHARLVAGGVADYTLDDLRGDCRRALLWMLAGTVGWLANADMAHVSGRERALIEAAIGDGRLITALLDHEVLSLLPRDDGR